MKPSLSKPAPATVRVFVRAQRDPKIINADCVLECNRAIGGSKPACQLKPGNEFLYAGAWYDVIAVDSGHPWEVLPAYINTTVRAIGYVVEVDEMGRSLTFKIPVEVTGTEALAQSVADALNADPKTFAHANLTVKSRDMETEFARAEQRANDPGA